MNLQTAITKEEIQQYRIPMESKIWDLYLNDKFYKENEKEILKHYDIPFEERYKQFKNLHKEITMEAKEILILRNLFKSLGLNREIFAFKSKSGPGKRAVQSFNDINKSIFIIPWPYTKTYFERELISIFSNLISDLFFEAPGITIGEYLLKKLNNIQFANKRTDIRRLLLLTRLLTFIKVYNADRFSILVTGSFEQTVSTLLKVCRLGVRRKNDINITRLLMNSRATSKINTPQNLNDFWPDMYNRIIAMFLFSKEYGFIESQSLKKIDTIMTLDDVLDYQPTLEKILKLYQVG